MKRFLPVFLVCGMLVSMLVACTDTTDTSTVASSSTSSEVVEQVQTEQSSSAEESSSEPGEAPEAGEEALEAMQAAYDKLAGAAGLEGTITWTMTDLTATGTITAGNIMELLGGQSIVGGDSGIVLVLAVEPGTAEQTAGELEAFRDAMAGGGNYEEFADSQEATRQARIGVHGDFVYYAVASVEAGASFDDIDAAMAELVEG